MELELVRFNPTKLGAWFKRAPFKVEKDSEEMFQSNKTRSMVLKASTAERYL